MANQPPVPVSTKDNPRLAFEVPSNAVQCDECGGCQMTDAVECDVLVMKCPNGHVLRYSIHGGVTECPECNEAMTMQSCGGHLHPLVIHE